MNQIKRVSSYPNQPDFEQELWWEQLDNGRFCLGVEGDVVQEPHEPYGYEIFEFDLSKEEGRALYESLGAWLRS